MKHNCIYCVITVVAVKKQRKKMLLNLTDLSTEPLQSQIVRQIRAKILGGELKAGNDIPSIRGLARQERVSFITVQRAYDTLVSEGLIHSRRGKGFFVSDLPDNDKLNMAKSRLTENIEPILKTSIAEGMSEKEIKNTVNKLLKKYGNNNK